MCEDWHVNHRSPRVCSSTKYILALLLDFDAHLLRRYLGIVTTLTKSGLHKNHRLSIEAKMQSDADEGLQPPSTSNGKYEEE
jgi:hypothetical protein